MFFWIPPSSTSAIQNSRNVAYRVRRKGYGMYTSGLLGDVSNSWETHFKKATIISSLLMPRPLEKKEELRKSFTCSILPMLYCNCCAPYSWKYIGSPVLWPVMFRLARLTLEWSVPLMSETREFDAPKRVLMASYVRCWPWTLNFFVWGFINWVKYSFFSLHKSKET